MEQKNPSRLGRVLNITGRYIELKKASTKDNINIRYIS
ncbi:hypothetical protein Phi18:3_gp102 [Cellulophaga phage phi18:3]|uniref:Uncharacterized protein n=1 Tax=Cellulophaga phage phi18:3 TaxID=1327983 RepID=R9ZZ45_9CAUD|nr:hypothetical protein Phi18:3_gp102 [Cellulophaga phage phi18:3]AGO48614.1 hypothetical protein Phi18:3_gp102 [Cellulophaga phage phi18:3]